MRHIPSTVLTMSKANIQASRIPSLQIAVNMFENLLNTNNLTLECVVLISNGCLLLYLVIILHVFLEKVQTMCKHATAPHNSCTGTWSSGTFSTNQRVFDGHMHPMGTKGGTRSISAWSNPQKRERSISEGPEKRRSKKNHRHSLQAPCDSELQNRSGFSLTLCGS